MTMEIILNKAPYVLQSAGQQLSDLMDELNLPAQAMAVAVNRTVITKTKWAEYTLKTQDRVDIVRAIGGG